MWSLKQKNNKTFAVVWLHRKVKWVSFVVVPKMFECAMWIFDAEFLIILGNTFRSNNLMRLQCSFPKSSIQKKLGDGNIC